MSRDVSLGDPPLIHHDLTAVCSRGDETWLHLTPMGTFDRLWWGHVTLSEGMELRFFCEDVDDEGRRDDLLGEGVAHYDPQSDRWVGIVRRGTLRNLSDFADEAGHWSRCVDWRTIWRKQAELAARVASVQSP